MQESKTHEFPRDRALPFFADASYAELAEVLPMPKCATKRQENVMAGIVAGMADHVRMRPADQFISYSRNRNVYPGQEMYDGSDWGYAPVVGSIDALADAGFMEIHDRKQQTNKAIGQQSRFIPNADLFKGRALPKTKKHIGQLIRIRERKERVLMPYRETEMVARMRKFVEKINAHLRDADIRFDGGVRRDGSICHFETLDKKTDKMNASAVDLDDIELYRVFSDFWSLGGRFYAGSWQSVPKGERKNYILDGENVVEQDYKNNHPSILYLAEGKPLDLNSDYDAYDIAWFRGQRTACKRALNILLNAKDLGRAIGAIREHVESETYEEARDLVEAIKTKHAPIAHYFHSDVGLKLQRLDADMCQSVLNEMTVKRGVTCLSLHDSFMVPQSAADELVRVMSSVFNKCTANITNSSFVSDSSSKTILNTGASFQAGGSVVGLPGSAVEDSESGQNGKRSATPKTNAKTVHPNSRFNRIKSKPLRPTNDKSAISAITALETALERPVVAGLECGTTTDVRKRACAS